MPVPKHPSGITRTRLLERRTAGLGRRSAVRREVERAVAALENPRCPVVPMLIGTAVA